MENFKGASPQTDFKVDECQEMQSLLSVCAQDFH